MKKIFKNNADYFTWYNENKDNIEIVDLIVTKDKIKLIYEKKIK